MLSISDKARKIIEEVVYINLATVTPEGEPWNSPLYAAFDNQLNFYWVSWSENQHSKNIRANGRAFITVYDSTQPEGTGDGVYLTATVTELESTEDIEKGIACLYGRVGKELKPAPEFTGDFPRRIYRATSDRVWMNGEGDIRGNYIDTRVEA